MQQGFELLELTKQGEEYQVRCALNGVPAVPFLIHVEEFNKRGEEGFFALCARQAASLIAEFGDGRYQRYN